MSTELYRQVVLGMAEKGMTFNMLAARLGDGWSDSYLVMALKQSDWGNRSDREQYDKKLAELLGATEHDWKRWAFVSDEASLRRRATHFGHTLLDQLGKKYTLHQAANLMNIPADHMDILLERQTVLNGPARSWLFATFPEVKWEDVVAQSNMVERKNEETAEWAKRYKYPTWPHTRLGEEIVERSRRLGIPLTEVASLLKMSTKEFVYLLTGKDGGRVFVLRRNFYETAVQALGHTVDYWTVMADGKYDMEGLPRGSTTVKEEKKTTELYRNVVNVLARKGSSMASLAENLKMPQATLERELLLPAGMGRSFNLNQLEHHLGMSAADWQRWGRRTEDAAEARRASPLGIALLAVKARVGNTVFKKSMECESAPAYTTLIEGVVSEFTEFQRSFLTRQTVPGLVGWDALRRHSNEWVSDKRSLESEWVRSMHAQWTEPVSCLGEEIYLHARNSKVKMSQVAKLLELKPLDFLFFLRGRDFALKPCKVTPSMLKVLADNLGDPSEEEWMEWAKSGPYEMREQKQEEQMAVVPLKKIDPTQIRPEVILQMRLSPFGKAILKAAADKFATMDWVRRQLKMSRMRWHALITGPVMDGQFTRDEGVSKLVHVVGRSIGEWHTIRAQSNQWLKDMQKWRLWAESYSHPLEPVAPFGMELVTLARNTMRTMPQMAESLGINEMELAYLLVGRTYLPGTSSVTPLKLPKFVLERLNKMDSMVEWEETAKYKYEPSLESVLQTAAKAELQSYESPETRNEAWPDPKELGLDADAGPGSYIAYVMAAEKWDHKMVAEKLRANVPMVEGLIDGSSRVSRVMAEKLAEALGWSAAGWLECDQNYHETIERETIRAKEHLASLRRARYPVPYTAEKTAQGPSPIETISQTWLQEEFVRTRRGRVAVVPYTKAGRRALSIPEVVTNISEAIRKVGEAFTKVRAKDAEPQPKKTSVMWDKLWSRKK